MLEYKSVFVYKSVFEYILCLCIILRLSLSLWTVTGATQGHQVLEDEGC